MTIYFRFNFFSWNLGVCAHGKPQSNFQQILIILCGPISSLLLGALLIFYITNGDYSDGFLTVAWAFIISSIFDFITNIIPSNQAINLFNGDIIYNDGTQLKRALAKNKLPDHYFEAERLFRDGQLKEAKSVMMAKPINKNVDYINLLLDTHIGLSEYDAAIDIFHEYKGGSQLSTQDKARLAEIFFLTKEFEKALEYYNDALYYDFSNPQFLVKRGIIKEKLSDIEGAVKDYYAAIEFNSGYSEAYARLASILLSREEYEESFNLLRIAVQVDESNALSFFLLGKYYMKKNMDELALENFLKAEELGSTEHGLDYHIGNLQADIEIRKLNQDDND